MTLRVPHADIDPIVAALAARRIALGVTQVDLAALLRVNVGTIGMWENGLTLPSLARIREWARVLGMAVWVDVGADVIGEAA